MYKWTIPLLYGLYSSRIYNDPYKGEGMGRVALRFFKEATGDSKVFVSSHDGQVREDGSHLTGDAPCFATKNNKGRAHRRI